MKKAFINLFKKNSKENKPEEKYLIKKGTFKYLEDQGKFGTLIINPTDYKKYQAHISALEDIIDVEQWQYVYIRPKTLGAFCTLVDTVNLLFNH